MRLTEGFQTVALKIQEEATDLSHRDIRSRLSDALAAHDKEEGCNSYLCDIFGDDDSGDVVYSEDGNLQKAPYSARRKH